MEEKIGATLSLSVKLLKLQSGVEKAVVFVASYYFLAGCSDFPESSCHSEDARQPLKHALFIFNGHRCVCVYLIKYRYCMSGYRYSSLQEQHLVHLLTLTPSTGNLVSGLQNMTLYLPCLDVQDSKITVKPTRTPQTQTFLALYTTALLSYL